MRVGASAGVAALLLLASSARATTVSTGILSSAVGTDIIRCDVINLSETKTVTVHAELIDGMGVVRENNDLTIPPLETREVAATTTQLAGRWCRVTGAAGKSKTRTTLGLFDGSRDTVVLEAH